MPEKTERLATACEIEEAFVDLFDRIDYGLHQYIGSINNRSMKKQALKNTVGMLEILKKLYRNDLHSQIR
jgi:CRISPR/Cas system type I-B associated protein Csh2 (Cas7 group RAMP superfamily)